MRRDAKSGVKGKPRGCTPLGRNPQGVQPLGLLLQTLLRRRASDGYKFARRSTFKDGERRRPRGTDKLALLFQGRKTMAPQTRPFIGVNVDYVAPSKHNHAHFRLPIGYVDSILP